MFRPLFVSPSKFIATDLNIMKLIVFDELIEMVCALLIKRGASSFAVKSNFIEITKDYFFPFVLFRKAVRKFLCSTLFPGIWLA